MLRANNNGDIYGFLDEGGHVDFHNIPDNFGEIMMTVKGNEVVEKRSLIFGEQSVYFVFTPEEINKIGVGSHNYKIVLVDEDGNRSTIIPDPSVSVKPRFNIEES